MNKLYHRTYFALILALTLALGMVVFAVRYAVDADQWASFRGNPHFYTDGQLDADVTLRDRDGEFLYSSADGGTYADRIYSRMSTLHLLGDRQGFISPVLLNEYQALLVGYNKIDGTYGMESAVGEGKLTICLQAQRAAMEYLDGYAGTVGVYNYRTGEILCAISTPTFDPDDVPEISDDDPNYDGVYVNRFLHGSYTPGSIFKLLTTAAAIENMPDWDSRTWYCDGTAQIGNGTVTCHGVHGEVTLREALSHSCNAAFAQITTELGPTILDEMVRRCGIRSQMSFDGFTTLPGSYDVSNASELDFAWSGIGQYTDQINPCQFMTLMGAIAVGGNPATPYLMEQVQCNDRIAYTAKQTLLSDYRINAGTAKILREMMRENVTTMYGGITLDLPICAKSGTAETGEEGANATFAGFIDSEQYPLAFIVVVEGGGSGSQTGAPIANAVLSACIDSMDGAN